jgi:hypothetical protein
MRARNSARRRGIDARDGPPGDYAPELVAKAEGPKAGARAALAVGANCRLNVITRATPAATQFAQFVLTPDGQHILARHGFDAR